MSKVVFICLLSISLCYSSPTVTQEKPVPPAAALADAKTSLSAKVETPIHTTHEEVNKTTENAQTEAQPVTISNTDSTTNNATTAVNSTIAVNATSAVNATTEKTTKPANATNNTTPDNKDNTKKDITKTPSTEVTPKPEVTTVNSTTVKPDQKPTAKPAQDVTTANAATTVKPTVGPTPDPKHEPAVVQARGFDGASFVGGMILTLGLLAVGFIGFKYYKNHSERNYHTL